MFDDKSQILLRRANKDTLILKYLNDGIPILLKPKTVFCTVLFNTDLGVYHAESKSRQDHSHG